MSVIGIIIITQELLKRARLNSVINVFLEKLSTKIISLSVAGFTPQKKPFELKHVGRSCLCGIPWVAA